MTYFFQRSRNPLPSRCGIPFCWQLPPWSRKETPQIIWKWGQGTRKGTSTNLRNRGTPREFADNLGRGEFILITIGFISQAVKLDLIYHSTHLPKTTLIYLHLILLNNYLILFCFFEVDEEVPVLYYCIVHLRWKSDINELIFIINSFILDGWWGRYWL